MDMSDHRTNRCCEVLTSPSIPAVLCNFLRASFHVGIFKTVGIYLEDITLNLGTTTTEIGVALGLLNAFSYAPAPLVAALYRSDSVRRLLLLIGSCLPAMGVALISVSTSPVQVTLFLSIAGLGNCILMTCCVLHLHRVATLNFNLLFGVSLTGFGFGMVLLPLLADELNKTYGWRTGLLVIGAVMANTVPCAAAMRFRTVQHGEGQNHDHDDDVLSAKESSVVSEDCCKKENPKRGHWCGIFGRITKNYNYDLSADSGLYIVLSVNFLFSAVYCGWHSFLVPHTIQRGFSIRDTIFVTFAAAIGNVCSRAAVGLLTNNLMNPINLHIIVTFINIAALWLDALLVNFSTMLVTSFVSSMSIGGRAVLGPLAVKSMVSSNSFDILFAVNEVFAGLGMLLGGYLSGMVADRFSSYDATFKLLAVIDVFVLLLMAILRCKSMTSLWSRPSTMDRTRTSNN